MYRLSPLTYIIGGMLGAAISDAEVTCANVEFASFSTPNNESCGSYAKRMIEERGGYILDPESTTNCQYCPISSTNQFLGRFAVNPANSWRDLGIVFAFIVFNSMMAVLLYWLFRVPKQTLRRKSGKK